MRNTVRYLAIILPLILLGCSPEHKSASPEPYKSDATESATTMEPELDSASEVASFDTELEESPMAEAAPLEKAEAPDTTNSNQSLAPPPLKGMPESQQLTPSQTPAQNKEALTSSMFSKEILSRKFILTANLNFRVKDVYQSSLEIENITYSMGGFVLRNYIRSETIDTKNYPQSDNTILQISRYRRVGELIVRVPTHQTQEFLRKLSKEIVYLHHREFLAEDIQINALRQQLAYQRNQEAQQSLGTAVNQVNRNDRIEAIQTQTYAKELRDNAKINQAYLDDQTKYSTIHLSIYQPEQIDQEKFINGSAIVQANKPPFSTQMARSLGAGWAGFQNFIVEISRFWVILAWLGLLAILIYKKYKTSIKAALAPLSKNEPQPDKTPIKHSEIKPSDKE